MDSSKTESGNGSPSDTKPQPSGIPPNIETHSSSDIEAQKLQLERNKLQLDRDKLDFEIRRSDEDRARRAKEEAKLDAELRSLRRPWYGQPSYLGPLATLLVALVGGFIAFGTDVFKSDVASLLKQRNQLTATVRSLNSEKQNLSKQISSLSTNNSQLQTDEDNLSRQLPLVSLKTHLKLLESVNPTEIERSNPIFKNIVSLVEQNRNDPDTIAAVSSVYADGKSPPQVKAALSYVLFAATKHIEWKKRLRKISFDGIAQGIRASQLNIDSYSYSLYFDLLADSSVFTKADKVQTLRDMYAMLPPRPTRPTFQVPPFNSLDSIGSADVQSLMIDDSLAAIVRWDEDATVAFRDPWFDYLRRLYSLREWEGPLFESSKLLSFSSEAFGILAIKSLRSDFTFDRDIPASILTLNNDEQCPYFPATFPLCQDWGAPPRDPQSIQGMLGLNLPNEFMIRSASLPRYNQWLNDHQELVSAFTDPDFTVLRHSSDAVMRRMFEGGWIDASDLKITR